jgi:hypothetical protein
VAPGANYFLNTSAKTIGEKLCGLESGYIHVYISMQKNNRNTGCRENWHLFDGNWSKAPQYVVIMTLTPGSTTYNSAQGL